MNSSVVWGFDRNVPVAVVFHRLEQPNLQNGQGLTSCLEACVAANGFTFRPANGQKGSVYPVINFFVFQLIGHCRKDYHDGRNC